MDITLVTASNSNEVHGTDNDKKTGCGINLFKGANVTIYRRIGRMTDLKEITCEKCKASLAKKMIKADKKEMSRLLKEEKQRAKLGMEDEGIVPLGNTTAKPTRAPEARGYNASAPAPQRPAAPQYGNAPQYGGAPQYNSPAPQPQYNNAPSAPSAPAPQMIPGTGVAMDDDLAAFAIQKPVDNTAQENDFLEQFAVQQPQTAPEPVQQSAPQQDDFLAQFAVQTPQQPQQVQQPQNTAPVNNNAVLDSVDDILSMFSVNGASQPQQQSAPSAMYDSTPNAVNAPEEEPIPYQQPQMQQPVQNAAPEMNDWDRVATQFFGGAPAQPQTAPVIEDISAPAPSAPYGAAQNNAAPQQSVFEDLYAEPDMADIGEVNNNAPAADDIPAIDDIAPVSGFADNEMSDLNMESSFSEPAVTEQPAPAQPPIGAAQTPQVISVPQLAGYDQNGQPIYNYIQMKMTGLDQNGRPVYVPINGQPPVIQAASAKPSAYKKPAYTGTPSANISKIAVNPHAKQTSQAFINAIASSKEYADKNLIDTQGLRANTPVLTSIEDVLSTMGDESAKAKLIADQQKAQQEKQVTAFNEYKGPTRQPSRSVPPQRRNEPSQQRDPRMMTKAELKQMKKQEKIDAKFRKEMAKRGF